MFILTVDSRLTPSVINHRGLFGCASTDDIKLIITPISGDCDKQTQCWDRYRDNPCRYPNRDAPKSDTFTDITYKLTEATKNSVTVQWDKNLMLLDKGKQYRAILRGGNRCDDVGFNIIYCPKIIEFASQNEDSTVCSSVCSH